MQNVPSQIIKKEESKQVTKQVTKETIKTKTKAETNDNKSEDKESMGLSENDINEMLGGIQMILSFLQTRTVRKETIGQGGQGKIRKYYSININEKLLKKW